MMNDYIVTLNPALDVNSPGERTVIETAILCDRLADSFQAWAQTMGDKIASVDRIFPNAAFYVTCNEAVALELAVTRPIESVVNLATHKKVCVPA